VTHDATPDCTVESEIGGCASSAPVATIKDAVLGVLERFDPLLPKKCAVTHGLAAPARAIHSARLRPSSPRALVLSNSTVENLNAMMP
jgi:hypothetical protein